MIKILLIEDDLADKMIVERALSKMPLENSVDHVGDIKSGLEFASTGKYNVVLCDFNLPDGDAVEFLSDLKLLNLKTTSTVVLTSQGDIEKATESLKQGAFDFVTKDNINKEALEKILQSIMRLQEENDIREKLQKQVDEINANTKAILENTNDGIWSLDLNGEILVINSVAKKKLSRISGHKATKGAKYEEVISPEIRSVLRPLFKSAINGKDGTLTHEFDEKGKKVFIEIACSPIINNNEITGATFFARDITERMMIQKELEEAQKTAEEALQFRTRFLATMSHEIRTPMNAMLGFANLLSKGDLDEEQKDYVQIIKNSGEDLLVIINDILDLSKIESGNMALNKVNFNLKGTAEKILTLHKFKAEEKGNNLRLETNLSGDEWMLGDDVKISQMLNNLISNAIKFTENGIVTLSVSSQRSKDGTNLVEFKITDTGIGIPEDKLDKVFNDYSQIESDLQRSLKGTGLGLAIVSNMTNIMGGEINVKSQIDLGSTFTLTIPLETGEKPDGEIKAENLRKEFEGYKLLVCDDIDVNRILVKKSLKKTKLIIEEAENGEEAIKKVKEFEPDLIFMDLKMPVMDGFRATEEIRKFSNVPIVAMTANVVRDELDKCFDVGMNDMIPKPFTENELFGILNQMLGMEVEPVVEVEGSEEFDWDSLGMPVLKDIADGDSEFAIILFDAFLNLVNEKTPLLTAAITNEDHNEIESIVHMMKSSFKTFGFDYLLNSTTKLLSEDFESVDLEDFVSRLEEAKQVVVEKKELVNKSLIS